MKLSARVDRARRSIRTRQAGSPCGCLVALFVAANAVGYAFEGSTSSKAGAWRSGRGHRDCVGSSGSRGATGRG